MRCLVWIMLVLVGPAPARGAELPAIEGSDVALGQDPGPPPLLWRIKSAGFASAAEAEDVAALMRGLGYAEVRVNAGALLTSVEGGVFETEFEAAICMEDLEHSASLARLSLFQVPASEEYVSGLSRRLPIQPIFRLEADNIAQTREFTIPAGDPIMLEGEAALAAESVSGDARLEEHAATLPLTDPRRGWLMMQRARRMVLTEDNADALDLFHIVADGGVAARHADRLRAMTNIGWLYEYRFGDYRRAFRACREEELFAADDEIRARMIAEQCWILVDQRRNDGVGEWPEIRRFVARALARVPESDNPEQQKHRAVIQLIHLETYSYEQNHEWLIPYGQQFVAQHRGDPARRREVGMALAFLGSAQARMQQHEDAQATFIDLLSMSLDAHENFAGQNLDAYAAEYLSHLSDPETRSLLREYMQEFHPDDDRTRVLMMEME